MTMVLLALGIALTISVATAGAAAAATTGSETVNGTLVTSGVSGDPHHHQHRRGRPGVFNGVGRIVEIPPQSGDAPNLSRDDLVYPEGTMHLTNTTVGASPPTLNPSCLFRVTLREDSQITGGTGLFAHASGTFTGAISPQGLLPRNPDGSCAVGQPSLHEVDSVTFSGTLSF